MKFFRLKHSFIYLSIVFGVLTALSCESFFGTTFCTGEDEVPVNKVLVREFITDQTFKNITSLRSYKFGSDDELNGIGPFDYTIDGKFAITGDGILNYGSDLKSFDQELKLNTSFSNSGFNFIEDYYNLKESYLASKRYLSDIPIPESSDSITLNLDLAIEFSNSLTDTIFLSKYQFIDSDTYEINRLQNLAYDKDGNILMLINEWITNIEYQNNSVNKVSEINGSHLVKIKPENKHDTLFTYVDHTKKSPYIQLRFSSTGAGIIISFEGNVYLLDQENKLNLLYSENLEGFLPDRSNLNGTAVFGDYGNQYYDFETKKHLDLTSLFFNTDKVVYGYPSNNGLLALKFGASGTNKNQEKILIYDTDTASLIDSVTFDDLLDFDIIDEYDFISGTYAKLINPVFTSDNRLIFMYVYEEGSYKCR